MDDHKPIDPLAIIAWAVSSTFGRIVAFAATCVAAVAALFVPFLVVWLLVGSPDTEARGWMRYSWLPVPWDLDAGAFVGWLAMMPLGIFQVWGILSYATLAGLFLWFTRAGADPRVALPATFLVQHLEVVRCVCHHDRWAHLGSPGILIDLAICLAVGTVWIVWVVRERRKRPLLG